MKRPFYIYKIVLPLMDHIVAGELALIWEHSSVGNMELESWTIEALPPPSLPSGLGHFV